MTGVFAKLLNNGVFSKWGFYISKIPFIFINWDSTIRKGCALSPIHLFIHLFFYIRWSHGHLLCCMSSNPWVSNHYVPVFSCCSARSRVGLPRWSVCASRWQKSHKNGLGNFLSFSMCPIKCCMGKDSYFFLPPHRVVFVVRDSYFLKVWHTTEKLLELINKFSKVAWYKISVKKIIVFLCTSNQQSENEI